MRSQVCVDASFALKLVLEEEGSRTAQALWAAWAAQDVEIIAPCHLIFQRQRRYFGHRQGMVRVRGRLELALLPTAQAQLPAQAGDAVAAGDEALGRQFRLEPAHPVSLPDYRCGRPGSRP